MDDLKANAAKTNARPNLLSHPHESIVETLNLNLRVFDNIQKDPTAIKDILFRHHRPAVHPAPAVALPLRPPTDTRAHAPPAPPPHQT